MLKDPAILLLIVTALTTIINATITLFMHFHIQKLNIEINSRMTELIKSTKIAGIAEGRVLGIDSERTRVKELR